MSEKFRTIYDRVRTVSNSGSPFVNDYQLCYNDDGSKELKVIGKHNLQDEINSYLPFTDVHMLIERFINLGDPAVLNKKPTFYGDVSNIPDTYAGILQFTADIKNEFDHLPIDLKNEFDNDVDKYISAIGTDKFKEVVDKFYPSAPSDELEREVKSDE